MSLNSLEMGKHAFYTWDVFDYLNWAERQDIHFDWVILDPPSFGRGLSRGRKAFSLKRNARQLIALATSRVAQGGHLYFSANLKTNAKGWLWSLEAHEQTRLSPFQHVRYFPPHLGAAFGALYQLSS